VLSINTTDTAVNAFASEFGAGKRAAADITVACIGTLLSDALNVFERGDAYPALKAHIERCEALPEFQATRAKWFAAEMQK
jgi:glutathione S-transferase